MLAGIVSGIGIAVAATSTWIAWPLPASVTAPVADPGVTLEDRHGLVLRGTRASDGSRMQWIPFADIDPKLILAFVAAEDRRFYDHGAIDLRATLRAVRDNLLARRVVSGASTITMQTARLVHPSARTAAGKLVQTLWALRLATHLDRQQILEHYLNRVPLGQGAVGVAAAASLYFSASAREVSLGQAALLAGLARAPSSDNPLVSPARARTRRAFALARLRTAGSATAAELARASEEPLVARERASPFLAPHFTTRVLQWAERDSMPAAAVWRTSLDVGLQSAIEAEVRHTVDDLHGLGAQHAAAVVLDNASGEILAWVGSPDFWAGTAGQTDMVISARQPGSALKPFLYGLAFDRGYTPATILADVAHTYQTSGGPYHPRNYDHEYHGPVRAREALASSYNIPAVELANRVGPSSLLATLHQAGFASLRRGAEYYGLGLALGNGDVPLLELANAYRALANGGAWRPYRWRAAGDDAHVRAEPGRRVMSERAAALVLDILSDPAARIPGFGLETPFDFPFAAAVKTGTSRHFTDNWAVATTGGFTVAVWVGNFNGRPMDGVSGVTGAGPLLRRAVMLTAARYAPGELPTPSSVGAVAVDICRASGLRAGPGCPHLSEWFVPGTEPRRECDWHRDGHVQFPAEYAGWAEQHADGDVRIASATRHAMESPEPADTRFRIVSPLDGDRYQVPPGVDARYATVALRVAGGATHGAVRWFIDGAPSAGVRFSLLRGVHTIRARAASGETDSVTVRVE